MIMCEQNLVKFFSFIFKILSKNQILISIKGHNSVANLQKLTLYKPNIDLLMIMYIQNLVKFCPFVLKILSRNQILMSTKGHKSVVNLRKMTLYNPNIDLVNDNVYNFWLNSVHAFSRYGAKTRFYRQSRAVTLLQICEK